MSETPHDVRWRVLISFYTFALFLLVISPRDGNFYPEGNVYFGPLWTMFIESHYDKAIGISVAGLLTPMILAFPVKPNVWTAAATIVGTTLWIGFGIWLAVVANA